MRDFVHPIVQQQAQAPRPPLAIIFLGIFVPNWLPTLLAQGLMYWPAFAALTTDHFAAYQVIFFSLQVVLIAGSIFWFSRKYPTALWRPQPSWGAA